ncbi:acyltransferase-domain-containing protein [Saitoella complicata NRRL Y-17804]|nr:acyltransferase-domain-containing protein [Saitoella complicata NRRL Y-17804]ODQ51235.1 acyltransferase-domain-containing protein [Saitoella complicata NRRL Y-17804]
MTETESKHESVTSPEGQAEPRSTTRNLAKHDKAHFRREPLPFLRELNAWYNGVGWRGYNDYIGQRIYYDGFTAEIKSQTLSSPILRKKIVELATKRAEVEYPNEAIPRARRRTELENQLGEVADKLADGMITRLEHHKFIRGACWMVNQMLARMYDQGIHVDDGQVQQLRETAMKAEKEGRSLIILPCHKSHIDYISIQIIFYRLGFSLPHVVAGDNLNFPVVGPFLQNAGGFYIRREWGDDALYSTLVHCYISVLLARGLNIECFIEGTRSRTGKLLPPKLGILKLILDEVTKDGTKDAYVVPVSVQYDRVIEAESYVSELLGKPKEKEGLIDMLKNWDLLQLRLGRIDVRFAEAFSLKEFVNAQETRQTERSVTERATPRSTYASSSALQLRILRALGYKVLADINRVSVVMPAALVGTVILTLRGRGVGKSELVRRVAWLIERVKAKGGQVVDFHGVSLEGIVERALGFLGDLVGEVTEKGVLEPTYYAKDRFQLSLYRNQVIHLFVSEAIIAAAMYTKLKQGGGPAHQRMPLEDLYDRCTFLSQLFKNEFIFGPQGFAPNMRISLEELKKDEVIDMQQGYVELSREERELGRENYDFYCFLLWPLVETYWLASVAMFALAPRNGNAGASWVSMKEFEDAAQNLGKTLFYQGDLSYYEAVSKETLRNAYQRLTEEGVITIRRTRGGRAPNVLRLSKLWWPARDKATGEVQVGGKLWDLVESIAVSRREGKNRRDNATVSRRVLFIADEVGARLKRQSDQGITDKATNLDVVEKGKKGAQTLEGPLSAKL